MLARVLSSSVVGIDALTVEVEVDIASGLPFFSIVGLAEMAVRESKERVKSAITNSGYLFTEDRVTVNLAPASVKKEGTGFDLPIALGILAAAGSLGSNGRVPSDTMVVGELSLDGRVKPVSGVLPTAVACRDQGIRRLVVPKDNAAEAAVVQGLEVLAVAHLSDVVEFVAGTNTLEPARPEPMGHADAGGDPEADFAEVQGQAHVKRALEVACSGGHNVLMIGPPGSGKTMLARRLPTILPPLTFDEALETSKIYSVAGLLKGHGLVAVRPFRSPHHTISDAGLIGGGHVPRPGEVSLAHNGVLFLDELPEFKKHVLEVLRQPMEDRCVTISRAATTLTYPASFMLVASMNPCPCGYLGDPRHSCNCSPRRIDGYRSRISGPLLDRIDIHVEVPAVSYQDLTSVARAEPSERIRERVSAARTVQAERFARTRIFTNATMQTRHVKKHCLTDQDSARLLEAAVDRLGLSARAYTRILKIARTIADLEGERLIRAPHVSEAIQYRSLDRAVPGAGI